MKEKKTAVIYARQSYGKEESALSVDQQIERCEAWCEKNSVEIVGTFKDNNTSSELYPNSIKGKAYCSTDIGWQRWRKTRQFKNRKAYRQGLADAFDCIEHGKIDYFVVDENTRFYRNPSATSQLDIFCIVQLQEAKTALVNVTENKIDHLESNINIAMWRAFAQYETEKMNEKAETSKANRRANINKGIIFSNAYGIDWIEKKICYNQKKSEVIKYVYDSILHGKTYAEILYTMNTVYKDLADGKCFYESSIYNIVSNSVYSGYKLLEGGRYIKIQNLGNSPIISFTAFEKANEIVKAKKKSNGKQKYNVKDHTKRNFLPFSGLLKCGSCKSKLQVVNDHGIVYFCKRTIWEKKAECTPSRIRFDWDKENLNKITNKDMQDFHLVIQPLFIIHLLKVKKELENYSNLNAEIDKLSAEVSNLKAKMKAITETFLQSDIDTDIFKNTINSAKKNLVEKENKIIKLKSECERSSQEELKEINSLMNQIQDSVLQIDNDTYCRLLRETIKEIFVFTDHIKIILNDGNSFNLPRIQKNKKSKILPFAKTETFIMDGLMKHIITYDYEKQGEIKTLLKTTDYEIRIVC